MKVRRGSRKDAAVAAELWLRSRRAAIPSIPPPAHTDDEVRGWFGTHVAEEPGRTGRGIGGGLMAVAKRERPAGLRLWTFVSNAGARRFYERHGFAEVERTDGAGNEERAPDILYAWSGASAAPSQLLGREELGREQRARGTGAAERQARRVARPTERAGQYRP